MITKRFCPVAGFGIDLKDEWIEQKCSKAFNANFYIIGQSIIYSSPYGKADFEGIKKSLTLNHNVVKNIKSRNRYYVQIEDLHSMGMPSLEARKYFIDYLDNAEGLSSLIFCNVSAPITVAIKHDTRFSTDEQQIYICKNYPEAIKLAIKICADNHIKIDTENQMKEFSGIENSPILNPIKLATAPNLIVHDKDLKDPLYVLNDNILLTKPEGTLMKNHMTTLNMIWQKLKPITPDQPNLEYILTDGSKLEGFQSRSLRPYGKLLRTLHNVNPIRMHIVYNTTEKIKTASRVANSFMPFYITTTKDLKEAYKLVQQDCNNTKKQEGNPCRIKEPRELLEFLNNMDWSTPGCEVVVDENHQDFVIMNAIKLLKEENDSILEENRQIELQLKKAAEEKQQLLRELQHRVKNSFFLIKSMIFMKKESNVSDETMDTLDDLEHSLTAISELYNLLYSKRVLKEINLSDYLEQLIDRYASAQNQVNFTTNLRQVNSPTDTIIPIGLIVTELITNSIKHAFYLIDDKKIMISLIQSNHGFSLKYCDNGNGLPGKDSKTGEIHTGQNLIKNLVKQIGASITYPEGEGFHCRIQIAE